jgi:hypothetical protein
MQATRWHVAATETLLCSCENQREIKCSVTTVEMEEIQHNTNKTETNVQHNSATTHTHKAQHLHTAVGAHRVCNGTRAVVAEVIAAL